MRPIYILACCLGLSACIVSANDQYDPGDPGHAAAAMTTTTCVWNGSVATARFTLDVTLDVGQIVDVNGGTWNDPEIITKWAGAYFENECGSWTAYPRNHGTGCFRAEGQPEHQQMAVIFEGWAKNSNPYVLFGSTSVGVYAPDEPTDQYPVPYFTTIGHVRCDR